ncbi:MULTISPECIES: hypothetical protein [unclassified Pseudoalteromonas]|uniref:hypothetical protein n=1 Tax=unclassified Pseudoalteromonas TaxID=194690 RepID=UPI0025B5F5A8|nr:MULTISPECIES: hypothetical protein [unclassified Pseudoalteromonas]MDN3377856.1 hypothetical protein [Pseudoalteromonas sp. APC 3893]MDN3386052.1 hypothetical protein [Pseudoalteromonas sp. APC 4017]
MEFSDVCKIIFGALLGAGLTILIDWLRIHREKTLLTKMLKVEISVFVKNISPWIKKDVNLFSETELPSLTPLPMASYGALPLSISAKVMNTHWAIKQANDLRILAINARNNGNDTQCNMFATLSKDWLVKSNQMANELTENL